MEIVNGTLRLLGDRMLVKPLDIHWSEHVIAVRKGRPVRGQVISVGKGEHPKRYQKDSIGNRKSYTLSQRFRPTEVKVGDIVELGGLNQFDGLGYQFTEVIYNGEKHLICSEKDVAAVVENAA